MHVGLVGILYESGLQRAKVPHICCAMILSDTDTQVEWALPIIMRKEKIQGNIIFQEHSYLFATTPVPHIIQFSRLGKSTSEIMHTVILSD